MNCLPVIDKSVVPVENNGLWADGLNAHNGPEYHACG